MNETFDWCVEFMIDGAHFLGITYKEFNVWLFVIIHPAITLMLIIWSIALYCKNIKLKRNTKVMSKH